MVITVNDNNEKYKHMRAVAEITQFGLSIVSPVVLCTLCAIWLRDWLKLGNWVVITAIILGVASGVLNMITFIKKVNSQMGGKDNDKKNVD